MSASPVTAPVIEIRGITTRFGTQTVHKDLDLTIHAGELVAVIGGSGTGKSVLLREIIGLQRPTAGAVGLLGTDVWNASQSELAAVRRRFGMMFQDGALFSSLTVAGNVAVPLHESGLVPEHMIGPLVALRLAQAGLLPATGAKMPSELSGGMRKRAAIARALALEPEVLFLDEPTSGLDPITARAFDRLLESLCEDLGITVVLVTHDLDTLMTIARRIVVLGDGRIVADGDLEEILASDDPWIHEYFSSRTTETTGMMPGPGSAPATKARMEPDNGT